MTPHNPDAETLFQTLGLHQIEGTESHLPTSVSVSDGNVRAFRHVDGSIGLVIPVSPEDYQAFRPDLRSQSIRLTKLIADGSTFIRLSLLDRAQEKIFSVFVDEVLKELKTSPKSASSRVRTMLQRWRRLFVGPSSPQPFTPAQEIGILCELEVLQRVLDMEGPEALHRWTGPESQPHDFELESESIECKATSSLNGLRVSIHGIHQLNPTSGKKLRLAVRQYAADPDGELSVADLCMEIYQRPDIAVDDFLEKLQKAGCPVFHPEADTVFQRYSPVGGFEFMVNGNFPRIDHIGAEQRIQQVNYVLDLSGPETVEGFQKMNQFLSEGK